jgi:succinate dehydrogenase / fumarate reductase membrane anchor subunit
MLDTPSVPKPREGTWLWLFKIAAGLLIVLLLGLHFVINHLVAPTGLLTYADVVAYYKVPIVPVVEVIFLVFVVSHALVGLRSILLDLNPSDRLLKAVDVLFWLVGAVSIVYGIWLVIEIASR